MKRITSLSLVFIIIISMLISSSIVYGEELTPRYTYTQSVFAALEIDHIWGFATCTGYCVANDAVPVKVMVILERYDSADGSWSTLRTWQAEGTNHARLQGALAIERGFTYRVRTVGYVYDSNNSIVEVVQKTDVKHF